MLNFDIVGLAETHLIKRQELKLKHYEWFGHNRHNIHFKAKTGSGGVGFLIRKSLLNEYDDSILDDIFDGIFGLNLHINEGVKMWYVVSVIFHLSIQQEKRLYRIFRYYYVPNSRIFYPFIVLYLW